ncbi:unnamed protein product [Echinostoma caproni]|uniref:COMM domain-containing protein n=1 Tax=Echinostoma caproni TaxID=27848 RepID=A0A183AN66_9TREM|nr:unnamed protein product [Echinostoma caproni]
MLILTKHEQPSRNGSGHRLRASDQQQIRRGILTLLRNKPTGSRAKNLDRLLASYLQPPIALLRASEDTTCTSHGLYHPAESACIPRAVLDNKFLANHRMAGSPRRQRMGKLLVLKIVMLSGCRVRLFQTEDCRFGLELWKLSSSAASTDVLHQDASARSNKLTLVTTLAALTENDYENFLGDLTGCLRESHTVLREVQGR